MQPGVRGYVPLACGIGRTSNAAGRDFREERGMLRAIAITFMIVSPIVLIGYLFVESLQMWRGRRDLGDKG